MSATATSKHPIVKFGALTTALALIVAFCGSTARASDAPPPLSTAAASQNIASTYGSGIFGDWHVDRFGLPAYRYTLDELTDPRARQAELAGSTDAWSQVGNDRFVANAYNHGYVQLWSQDRTAQWMNRYDAEQGHYSGGYGYLNVNGKPISSLYDDRPVGAATTRQFGVGYYGRAMQTSGTDVNDVVYAPFGNDPVLVHDVTITNTTKQTEHVSWFEYWDVNPYLQASGQYRGLAAPRWNASTHTLSVAQLPDAGDTDPLSIFAAQVKGPTASYDTTQRAFFGSGTRARPQAVAAGHLHDSRADGVANGTEGTTLFALETDAVLRPGQSTTLRYLYGYGHPGQIPALVAKYRHTGDPFATSERAWYSSAAEGLAREQPAVARSRAHVGRLPPAFSVGLRRDVRRPHDHAGRVLPVRPRPEPRNPQLAALSTPNDLPRPGARPRDPHVLDAVPTRGEQPASVRVDRPLRPVQPGNLGRPGLLAAARLERVRAGDT